MERAETRVTLTTVGSSSLLRTRATARDPERSAVEITRGVPQADDEAVPGRGQQGTGGVERRDRPRAGGGPARTPMNRLGRAQVEGVVQAGEQRSVNINKSFYTRSALSANFPLYVLDLRMVDLQILTPKGRAQTRFLYHSHAATTIGINPTPAADVIQTNHPSRNSLKDRTSAPVIVISTMLTKIPTATSCMVRCRRMRE